MRPSRIAWRKLRSQSGTCRDSSAKSMNVGEALYCGGSSGSGGGVTEVEALFGTAVVESVTGCSMLFIQLRCRLKRKRAGTGKAQQNQMEIRE